MKKIAFILLVSIFLFGCVGSSKLSKSGSKEKDIVINFIDLMVYGTEDDLNKEYKPLISPKYIKENKIDIEKYELNYYNPKGYSIETYNPGTGIVEAKIWGADKDWMHLLEFKVVKEKGKLYLYPEKHTDSKYIYPWYKATTNIE